MRSNARSRSHLGMMTSVAGPRSERAAYTTRPYEWCRGRNARFIGIPRLLLAGETAASAAAMICARFIWARMFPWDIITATRSLIIETYNVKTSEPFGGPLVPLEKRRYARVSFPASLALIFGISLVLVIASSKDALFGIWPSRM